MRTFRYRHASEYYRRRSRREGYLRYKRLFTHNLPELREIQKESVKFLKSANLGPYPDIGKSFNEVMAESITSILGNQQFASRFAT